MSEHAELAASLERSRANLERGERIIDDFMEEVVPLLAGIADPKVRARMTQEVIDLVALHASVNLDQRARYEQFAKLMGGTSVP